MCCFLSFINYVFYLLLLLQHRLNCPYYCVYVCTHVGDDDKADGSKPTQALPAGFACVNQVTSGFPAQSAVSSQVIY